MTGRGLPAVMIVAATLAAVLPARAPRRRLRVLDLPASTCAAVTAVREVAVRACRLTGHADRPGTAPAIGVLAGGVGFVLGGPVAAFVAAVYAALLVRGLRRRGKARLRSRRLARELDALCALAADLRAGLPPAAVAAGLDEDRGPGRLAVAAVRLAEATGAPLADLIERIEADARGTQRAAIAAVAQAAGVRATAWLLAALPLGGIALGFGIGTDPLNVLLHSPLGGCCAVAAVLLQAAGLAWTDRLVRLPGGAA